MARLMLSRGRTDVRVLGSLLVRHGVRWLVRIIFPTRTGRLAVWGKLQVARFCPAGRLAYARIFFRLTPYFDPQILIADPFILILILKNFDQNL